MAKLTATVSGLRETGALLTAERDTLVASKMKLTTEVLVVIKDKLTVYEPSTRALCGTASHFCEAVVLKLRTVPIGTALIQGILVGLNSRVWLTLRMWLTLRGTHR